MKLEAQRTPVASLTAHAIAIETPGNESARNRVCRATVAPRHSVDLLLHKVQIQSRFAYQIILKIAYQKKTRAVTENCISEKPQMQRKSRMHGTALRSMFGMD